MMKKYTRRRRRRRKREEEEEEEEEIQIRSELPTDIIIEEILSRLPVKSLMRFKCVSKQWQNLFADPRFITKHVERSTDENRNPTLILQLFLNRLYSSKIESNSTATQMKGEGEGEGEQLGEQLAAAEEWGFPVTFIACEASCDGLVCLRLITKDDTKDKDDMFIHRFRLYNPATRESLPLPQDPDLDASVDSFSIYALGVNPITKEYKVAKISYHKPAMAVKIYTVGDASHGWKKIPYSFPFFIGYPNHHNPSICVGGSLHWLASRPTNIPNVIVCLDLHREVFQQMPSLPFYKPHMKLCLGYLGGCLSVSTSFPMEEDSIDLWVMKQYGVRDSWAKVFKMKSQVSPGINITFASSRGFFNDGREILLMTNTTAPILYNLETQEMKTITKNWCLDINLLMYTTFVETLVSLKVESSSETSPYLPQQEERKQEGI